jgi:ABC-type sugar transport system ATPase subunit
VVQLLGRETLVMVTVGDQLVSVTINADDPHPQSEQVWLEFNPGRVFFYNAEGNLIR